MFSKTAIVLAAASLALGAAAVTPVLATIVATRTRLQPVVRATSIRRRPRTAIVPSIRRTTPSATTASGAVDELSVGRRDASLLLSLRLVPLVKNPDPARGEGRPSPAGDRQRPPRGHDRRM
jgi:hypothetical protein